MRHDQRLANRARPPSCEFEDLARMDCQSLATLFSTIDDEVATLALAGAPLNLVGHVLARLSPHRAGSLRRMTQCLGPTRLTDIDEAQRRISERATQLAEHSRID